MFQYHQIMFQSFSWPAKWHEYFQVLETKASPLGSYHATHATLVNVQQHVLWWNTMTSGMCGLIYQRIIASGDCQWCSTFTRTTAAWFFLHGLFLPTLEYTSNTSYLRVSILRVFTGIFEFATQLQGFSATESIWVLTPKQNMFIMIPSSYSSYLTVAMEIDDL